MENASKALLMAGGILISVIILTIAVTLYSLYSGQAKEYGEIISTTEIQKFNSKFDVYLGRDDIAPQEIATVINLAKQYDNTVEIKVGMNKVQFAGENTPEKFIADNFNSTFSCPSIVYNKSNPTYDETGKITRNNIYREYKE